MMEMFDDFEVPEYEQDKSLEAVIVAWQREQRELRSRLVESEAKQRELEQSQEQILAQAQSIQQSMALTSDGQRISESVHCLYELDHLFKQTTLSLEHEAMKQRFLRRYCQTLAAALRKLSHHLGKDAVVMLAKPQAKLQTRPQSSTPMKAKVSPRQRLIAPSYGPEPSLRDRLKRPYNQLKRFALWASGSFVGAIAAVSLLCSALLAAGADDVAHAVLRIAMVFGARYLMALLGLWVCTAVREAF